MANIGLYEPRVTPKGLAYVFPLACTGDVVPLGQKKATLTIATGRTPEGNTEGLLTALDKLGATRGYDGKRFCLWVHKPGERTIYSNCIVADGGPEPSEQSITFVYEASDPDLSHGHRFVQRVGAAGSLCEDCGHVVEITEAVESDLGADLVNDGKTTRVRPDLASDLDPLPLDVLPRCPKRS